MNLIEELILEAQQEAEDLVDAMEQGDELYEALKLGLLKGELEAVCPLCGKIVPNYTPGQVSLCRNYDVDPEEIIYRAPKPS